MRAKWQLMKALADHMRVGPESRVQKLLAFNRRLRTEPKVTADLEEWNLKLDEQLTEIPGRVVPMEKIVFGNQRKVEAGHEADWTNELRNIKMLTCGKLDNWALIVTSRAKRDVDVSIKKKKNKNKNYSSQFILILLFFYTEFCLNSSPSIKQTWFFGCSAKSSRNIRRQIKFLYRSYRNNTQQSIC